MQIQLQDSNIRQRSFYLAARWDRHEEINEYARTLRYLGHIVTSQWHQSANVMDVVDRNPNADKVRYARKNISEINISTDFIAFTEDPDSAFQRGGRHVEYGIALQRSMPITIIGSRENAFHWFVGIPVYDNWQQFLTTVPNLVPEIETEVLDYNDDRRRVHMRCAHSSIAFITKPDDYSMNLEIKRVKPLLRSLSNCACGGYDVH